MEKLPQPARNYCVPKLIHFIWAGGDKLMVEDKELDVVTSWCTANPNCRVILWVDAESYSGQCLEMIHEYQRAFESRGISLITDLHAKKPGVPSLIIQDISEIEDYKDLLKIVVRSEISQLYPNFGCSSDIIRLLLLRKGGCYFDQDVECNPELSLEQSGIFEPRELPLLILEHRPQRAAPETPQHSAVIHGNSDPGSTDDQQMSPSKMDRSGSDEAAHESKSGSGEPSPKSETSSDNSYKRYMKVSLEELGNDAIICTSDNPVIDMYLDRIFENYHLQDYQTDLIIAECYGERDRRNRSIARTGPNVTQSIFRKNPNLYVERTKKDDIDGIKLHCYKYADRPIDVESQDSVKLYRKDYMSVIEFQPMRSKLRELTVPITNSQNWLNVPIKIIEKAEDCHLVILERIKSEIKFFKILRLDDHIDAMLLSMKLTDEPHLAKYNTTQLLQEILQLNLHEVKIAQITFTHPESVNFCLKNRITTIINLDQDNFIKAFCYSTNFPELNRVLSTLQSLQESHNLDLHDLVARLNPRDVNQLNNLIYLSMTRLEALINNFGLLPLTNQLVLTQFIHDNQSLLLFEEEFYSCSHDDFIGLTQRCTASVDNNFSKTANETSTKNAHEREHSISNLQSHEKNK